MAGEFPWLRETPELDYATTESSGENVEELQSPPTPEISVAGLAFYPESRVESFFGEQYAGYEPEAVKGLLQHDFEEQEICALNAPIGFESQRTESESFCQQHPAGRLEFGEIQAIGATAEGHTVLEPRSPISFGDVQYLHSVEAVPVNERLVNPNHIPRCFIDVHADLRCFNCGQDPTFIHIDHNAPSSSAPTSPPQHSCSPSPSRQQPVLSTSPPTARAKVRIQPSPASIPRAVQKAATCEWCGKTFSRSGGLPRHQSASCPKRPIDVRRSLFVCLACGEVRPRKDKIQLHCQKKHGQVAGKERLTERI